jgi:hypothetical protein
VTKTNVRTVLDAFHDACEHGRLTWTVGTGEQFAANLDGGARRVVVSRFWEVIPVRVHTPPDKDVNLFGATILPKYTVPGDRPTERTSYILLAVWAIKAGEPEGEPLIRLDSRQLPPAERVVLEALWGRVVDAASAPDAAVAELSKLLKGD